MPHAMPYAIYYILLYTIYAICHMPCHCHMRLPLATATHDDAAAWNMGLGWK